MHSQNDNRSDQSEPTEDKTILSPYDALKLIDQASKQSGTGNPRKVLLVDTHGHPHLERERTDEYILVSEETFDTPLVSLTCAVQESDWKSALDYASRSDSILPALGVHPWYLADLSRSWLEHLETLLLTHPSAVVGEIGLCKIARFVRTHPDGKSAALLIQRQVFRDQMKLAAKLRRPVTVHCVKQHGVFMSVLNELVQQSDHETIRSEAKLPPAIGMHSFTGTAHHVKEILDWEAANVSDDDAPIFYFGFSHAVNYVMCTSEKSRRQGLEAIRAVPFDRLLAESDVHAAEDVLPGTAGAIAYLSSALDRSIEEVAEQTAYNGLRFLGTVLRAPT